MTMTEETREPTIAEYAREHPTLTLSRIDYLELMLDKLSRQVMERCNETHSANEDMKQTLDKARMAGGLIRSYQHLIEMRAALIARNPDDLTAPALTAPKKNSGPASQTKKKISEDQAALIDAAISAPETPDKVKGPLKNLRHNYKQTARMKKNLKSREDQTALV